MKGIHQGKEGSNKDRASPNFAKGSIDRQDNRDGTLVPEKPAPAMIGRGIADAQDYRTTDFQE